MVSRSSKLLPICVIKASPTGSENRRQSRLHQRGRAASRQTGCFRRLCPTISDQAGARLGGDGAPLRAFEKADVVGALGAASEAAMKSEWGTIIVSAIVEHLRTSRIVLAAPGDSERIGVAGRAMAPRLAADTLVVRAMVASNPPLRIVGGTETPQSGFVERQGTVAGSVERAILDPDGTSHWVRVPQGVASGGDGRPPNVSAGGSTGDGGGGGHVTSLWKLDVRRDVQIAKWPWLVSRLRRLECSGFCLRRLTLASTEQTTRSLAFTKWLATFALK